MELTLVLGTRPQIIKSAPIIKEANENPEINLDIIHTGQHYDYEMSRIFFDEMSLPDPTLNLEVGSGSHAWQTGKMLIGIEKALSEISPDLVIIPGDTNSTLACALAASKMNIKTVHVEAGARSYDMRMPEEVNRRLTDHCSDILFTVSENCSNNLLKEAIPQEKIFRVGDTMYDVLLQHRPLIEKNQILDRLNLEKDEYAVITTHRQENVDNEENLNSIVEAILELHSIKIAFPIHPRTEDKLKQMGLYEKLRKSGHVLIVPPVGYHEMLKLIMNSKMLLTDSGGMQKEAYWLKTRCITLRDTTEWVETIRVGANTLVGADKDAILKKSNRILGAARDDNLFAENFFGDGKAAKKIIQQIKKSIF
jgi:UDP-N-acetylglucosamine 2-epimerase